MYLGFFFLSETKIDETFPATQFNVQGYEIRAWCDEDKYGEDLIEFVQRSLICKRLWECESKYSQCLCSELTFTNKEWKYFSIYRHDTDHLNQPIYQCFSKNCQYLKATNTEIKNSLEFS